MNWTSLFFICAVLLFTLPMVPALIEWRQKKDCAPLKVVREYDGNITFFATSFRRFLDEQFAEFLSPQFQHQHALNLSLADGSPFQLVAPSGLLQLSQSETEQNQIKKIILAKTLLTIQDGLFFEKEMYLQGGILGGHKNSFRSILADADIRLGNDCALIRWVHSQQSIYLGERTNIYGRISADQSIHLAKDTRFGRMFAPVIHFGVSPEGNVLEQIQAQHKQTLQYTDQIIDHSAKRWLAKGSYEIATNQHHQGDIVAQQKLRIFDHCHIEGSVKSSGDLIIGDHCVIDGAVVSEGVIFIGQGCRIKGPLIGEKMIHIGHGSQIGSATLHTTITAPRMRIDTGVVAYGAVWAREMGYVNPASQA